ncbi:potassium channel family protein [Streptosporangium sp. NBC_01469]|uniref:potassium channel family protein n=1 Tax=Streptosporangium sp. NBC_01469 TaxID=2903898 RepID=UPI002E2E42F6|nr:TrkA family potassium uptake protein [Streptosporangium sp. NBC_01469]
MNRDAVVVVGLGRFGGSLTTRLTRRGVKVLAIDTRREAAHAAKGPGVTCAVADATDPAVLRKLGVAGYRRVVVTTATDLQTSVLLVSALVELNIGEIWAKAVGPAHERLLRRIGAHQVFTPAREAGVRLAHLLDGQPPDRMPSDENLTITTLRAPLDRLGVALPALHLRDRYGITLIAVKHEDGQFTHASPTTELSAADVILICGHTERINAFTQRPDS